MLAERRELPPATQAALADLQALPDDAAWRHVVRADLEFHRGLVEAAGNARLARAHRELLAEIALCIAQTGTTYEQASEVAREHERLARAIRSGNADRAERELDAHYAEGMKRLR
jgi:DNA-binding GntR family transcriptional regulator